MTFPFPLDGICTDLDSPEETGWFLSGTLAPCPLPSLAVSPLAELSLSEQELR